MNFTESPYKKIPYELVEEYTMNNKIKILDWWRDDSCGDGGIKWSNETVEKFIHHYTIENIKAGRNGWSPYGNRSVQLLLHSFVKYNIQNMNVAVIGSLDPWIEAMLLNLNNKVTTVEYNSPVCESSKIKCIDYFKEFENSKNMYDCIVTFSSVEHSGLGRYGDPLDPNGDIKTMKAIHNNLKKDGILIWGGPIGHDALVWNVHRVYGRIRLPLLFNNFEEIEWIGFDKDSLLNTELRNNGEQPVIVLKRT